MNTLEQLRAGELVGSRRLKLACGLSEFPHEIFELAETLEILDLSGNALSKLPDDLPLLRRLRILFCSDSQFTELPAVLGQCRQLSMIGFKANQISSVPAAALPPELRWLILTDNQISELPAEIGHCSQMQKLMLAGNRLQSLPPEMANCKRLELLRIAANQLAALPDWLFSLPRLSWLAYAGNPFCENTAQTPIARIAWHELQLLHQLGEGASGVIHQAEMAEKQVAVKLFKGALTSDGLPGHEMNACISAGTHPNLIPVLGKIEAHPENVDGLVMALIEHGFTNLAGPPSLDSCTRDVYPDHARFTLSAAIRLALGIASAACHLHAQGIVHGDLYAHNILHAADGEALLGDFGAASFFSHADQPQAEALQRIEVRAFGCLLEELIERSIVTVDGQKALNFLVLLQADCAQENIGARPLFAEIMQRLGALLTG
ncbi:MAG: leucine-rich repeat-containing protein kinase family protein [Rhodocyclaceae bacterium]|nr:leucine-rich repeat-containing protein kinase family protein [Rhodocyclaceae bacterium]